MENDWIDHNESNYYQIDAFIDKGWQGVLVKVDKSGKEEERRSKKEGERKRKKEVEDVKEEDKRR